MEPQTKTIEGAHGACEYSCIPHAAEDAVDLMPVLLTIAAPIVGALFSDGGEGSAASGNDALSALEDLAGGGGKGKGLDSEINGAAFEDAIRGLAMEFAKAGGSRLCMKLLKHTTRVTPGGEKAHSLGKKQDFNEAFQANYLELGLALAFVIRVNYLPSSRAGHGDGLIARLTQSLGTLRN